METRIRELRKRAGLTLQQLAARVGTTPQTVQRLETANMTVSTDWLERFAEAFGVHPADLFHGSGKRAPSWLGSLGRDGAAHGGWSDASEDFSLDVPAEDPVAMRVDTAIGPYAAGTVLIANRLSGQDTANAHGADCLVALEGGLVLLRRVIAGAQGTVTLVPLTPGSDIRYDQSPVWIARIIMAVRYI